MNTKAKYQRAEDRPCPVSLAWIRQRTGLSTTTIRRALENAGIQPGRLGQSPNAALRYPRRPVENFLKDHGFEM